jgi:3-oxoacyl-[acyl-carrier-protein] synthase II
VVAAKSNFGNLGAGSAIVELAASILALKYGTLFPVLNYEAPDPDCPVAAVRSAGVPAGGSFVSLSVTPQGQASAVLVRRFAE